VTQPETPDRPAAATPLPLGGDAASYAPDVGPWLAKMRPRLFRLAYRMLWNSHDAEEVVQDSLATALGRVGQLRDPGKRNTWIYRVAINLSKHRLRSRRRRFVRIEPTTAAAPEPNGGRIEHQDLYERLRQAMADLPARQRTAVVLRDMEQLEYDKIAAILTTRPSAARILVHRGREGVRRILLKRWPESFEDLDR
jgi:RNA polymerase sigma-70 factor (ECF subfamily)